MEDRQGKSASDISDEALREEFIQKLTDSQSSLRAYLLAAMGNYDDASEVLQRTCIVLWRNAMSFRPGAEFMPWALTLAKFEVMSFYRDRNRDRHVFSEDLAVMMLETAAGDPSDVSDRQAALRSCVGRLPEASREMIRLRYEKRTPIAQIAPRLDRTEGAIKAALVRIRRALAECITKRLGVESPK